MNSMKSICLCLGIMIVASVFSLPLQGISGSSEWNFIRGYLKDKATGNPILGGYAAVQAGNSHSNLAVTDPSGYYEISVADGIYDMFAMDLNHNTPIGDVTIFGKSVHWVNFSPDPAVFSLIKLGADAILCGYVKDKSVGGSISDVYIELSNQTYKNNTLTNATGFYEIYSEGGVFTQIAYHPGYLVYFNDVTLVKNKRVWVNISLERSPPETATVQGGIRDALTNNPIQNARVEISNMKNWFNVTNTDATGFYKLGSIPGKIYMKVSTPGYHENSTSFSIGDGEIRWVNLSLYPQLPENVTLKGYIWDMKSSHPVDNATIRISGYPGQENETRSRLDGYYEMMIVQAKQNIFVRSRGHVPNSTTVLPAGKVLWMNFTMEGDWDPADIWRMSILPRVNVSYSNPAHIFGEFTERCLKEMDIYIAEYRNGTGNTHNYSARLMYSSADTPDAFPLPLRKVIPEGSHNYTWKITWNATTDGGLLGNMYERVYANILRPFWTQDAVILGVYKNATIPTPLLAISFYDSTTGTLREILVDPDGINKRVNSTSDPTGMFGALTLVFEVDFQHKNVTNVTLLEEKMFSIKNLDVKFVEKVRSGEYLGLEVVTDWADNVNSTFDRLWIDNDEPAADAGGDIRGFVGRKVTFDGSRSSDNVGIVNYTWEFIDSSPRKLYGEKPEYTFNSPGVYNVTLTVTDGANNSATDLITVNISYPPGHISGKVLSGQSPVPDASVKAYIHGSGEIADEITTDASGFYNLTGLISGEIYDINVTVSGYIPSQKNGIIANATGINFNLERQIKKGWISGRVYSKDTNDPIQGVKIIVYRNGSEVANTSTDPAGRFNITLDPGIYSLDVRKSGYQTITKSNITVEPEKETSLVIVLLRESGEITTTISMELLVAISAVILILVLAIILLIRRREPPVEKEKEKIEKESDKNEKDQTKEPSPQKTLESQGGGYQNDSSSGGLL